MDMFDGHLVLSLSKKGFSMLCSINLPVLGDCKVFIYLLSYIFSYKHKNKMLH